MWPWTSSYSSAVLQHIVEEFNKARFHEFTYIFKRAFNARSYCICTNSSHVVATKSRSLRFYIPCFGQYNVRMCVYLFAIISYNISIHKQACGFTLPGRARACAKLFAITHCSGQLGQKGSAPGSASRPNNMFTGNFICKLNNNINEKQRIFSHSRYTAQTNKSISIIYFAKMRMDTLTRVIFFCDSVPWKTLQQTNFTLENTRCIAHHALGGVYGWSRF